MGSPDKPANDSEMVTYLAGTQNLRNVMARFIRATHAVTLALTQRLQQTHGMYFVYLMASQKNGTLYCGVTSDLLRRAYEHREGLIPGFTQNYGVKRLVWFEPHDSVEHAIRREKRIKKYPRQWKLNLIEADNPDWADLYNRISL